MRSWVDETVRDAAGAPRAGSRDALRAVPFASARTFHACEPDAVAAFEAQYDEVATLYHRHDGDLIDGLPPSPGPGTAHAATAAAASDDLASWFTTLARQMAATAQAARELPTGEGIGGAPTLDRLDDRSAVRALDAHALGGHDLVLVLAVAPPPPPPPPPPRADPEPSDAAIARSSGSPSGERSRGGRAPAFDFSGLASRFRGVETALKKDAAVAHLLALGAGRRDASATILAHLDDLFRRFEGCACPASLVRASATLPPLAALDRLAAEGLPRAPGRDPPSRDPPDTRAEGSEGGSLPLSLIHI